MESSSMVISSHTHQRPDEETFNILVQQLRKKVFELDIPITPRTDDAFLAKFLRAKHYVVDAALESLKRYYANVKRNLDYIDGIRPSDFEHAFHNSIFTIFKHRSNGRRIGAAQVRHWRPKEVAIRDAQLAAIFATESILTEVETQENGVVIIFDLKGLSFEHIRHLTPRELKRILLTGQEGLPMKISEVHIINPPPLYWSIHQISMRFVKEKIRKRIHLHYSYESLHKYLDASICPESLGGLLGDEEARDNDLIHDILTKNAFYESHWNGGKPLRHQRLSRKRSSTGEILGMACN